MSAFDDAPAAQAIDGYAEMMEALAREFDEPELCEFHGIEVQPDGCPECAYENEVFESATDR